MGKVVKMGLGAIVFLVVLYVVFRGISSWTQGYSWEEMDWSQKGQTTITDFFAASDVGKREITRAGRQCIEYFSYKDGMTVKTVCRE
ncbi:hypothetical protein [Pseudomonas capsici]|uniref:hypothetical protein n=1 Tax=Pseudomonas capsici TaxID=2810614 RepID=UPI0021F0DDD2|nr:hypothetical protein [Pseudomonas capsici]MCV4340733.1 hypothetical protein [Pseudomonas capsici]